MAMAKKSGFDVTAVIGHVEYGGDQHLFVSAFTIIGNAAREQANGESRTYSFNPDPSDNPITVTVNMPNPERNDK